MTSKRMGIVLVALVAVWGLAGPVGHLPIAGDLTGPVVGTAQAGDPDHYVGNACSSSDPPGSPPDSTQAHTGYPPQPRNDDGGRRSSITQKGAYYVSLFFWIMTRSKF